MDNEAKETFAGADRINWREIFTGFAFIGCRLFAIWAKIYVLGYDVVFTTATQGFTYKPTTPTRVGHNEI